MGWDPIPVLSPSLWAVLSTEGVHSSDEGSHGSFEAPGLSQCCLSGRHLFDKPGHAGSGKDLGHGLVVDKTRFCHQLEEIVKPNLPSSGISRLYSGHCPVDSEPAPGEGGQDIADMFGPSREEVLLSSHSGLFDGQTSKCLHSNSARAPACEEHADGQYQGSGKVALQLCSSVRTLGCCASRVAVVDPKSQTLEREIFCESRPRAGCDNHIGSSNKGLGAEYQGLLAQGQWSLMEKEQHINVLELWVAELALRSFTPLQGRRVCLRLDFGQNLPKCRFWSTLWKISILGKIFENLDFRQNFLKISILVKIPQNVDVGQHFRKSRFWTKFSENLDLGQNFTKFRFQSNFPIICVFGQNFRKSWFSS